MYSIDSKIVTTTELYLNKVNSIDTKVAFLDLHLLISTGFVLSKIYDQREDFYFDTVNFPLLDGDVPRVLLVVLTFLSLFGLLAYLVIWLTSMLVTKL